MNWYALLKLAAYEQYQDKIDMLARNNPYPFKEWFGGKSRVYIPLEVQSENGDFYNDDDVDIVNVLTRQGYEITDYRGGYCSKDGRTWRIGKVLQQLRKNDLQDLQTKYQNEEIYNLEREVEKTQFFYNNLMAQYQSSSARASKGHNKFSVVISQDPHDIAQMSTDRNWTSCMALGKGDEGGQHQDSVFCEVQNGGLIAYLIYPNDTRIDNPLARIHLRRFENINGASVAIPEKSIYGNEVPGFLETVQTWLDQRQTMDPGMYTRQGGSYSDTFSSEMLIAPTTKEDIVKWLTGNVPEESKVHTKWIVTPNIDGSYFGASAYDEGEDAEDLDPIFKDDKTFRTKEEADEYVDNHWLNEDDDWRYGIGEEWAEYDDDDMDWKYQALEVSSRTKDYSREMQIHAIDAILAADRDEYPIEILQHVKAVLFPEGGYNGTITRQKTFVRKYPELVTEEDVGKVPEKERLDVINDLPEETKQAYINMYAQEFLQVLQNPEVGYLLDETTQQRKRDISLANDIQGKVRAEQTYVGRALNNIRDRITHPITQLFSPIPEEMTQAIVAFASQAGELLDFKEKTHDELLRMIIEMFAATKTDTPTVQRFYQTLLPKWKDHDLNYDNTPNDHNKTYHYLSTLNVYNFGRCIANLGENGRDFLPVVKQKFEEATEAWLTMKDKKMKSLLHKDIEKYLYIMDSIETGKGFSHKYRFFN